jgi:hypothetical protein
MQAGGAMVVLVHHGDSASGASCERTAKRRILTNRVRISAMGMIEFSRAVASRTA